MDADYSFYVKTIETYARAFLALNISVIGRVKTLLDIEITEPLFQFTIGSQYMIKFSQCLHKLAQNFIFL